MGKTYNKQRNDDEFSSGRSGKHSKHANGKKTGGMKTLNSYVEEEYDDPFVDEVDGITDEIFIQHIKQDDTN
jgi:hypothetical protein